MSFVITKTYALAGNILASWQRLPTYIFEDKTMEKFTAKLLSSALIMSCALASATANASLITYDTRSITSSTFGNYQAGWSAQSSTVSTSTLGNFNGSVGGNTSYDHLTVNFNVSSAKAGSSAIFELAPDAGYGGALYLDGALLNANGTDLWWGGNWANTSELLIGNVAHLGIGNHVLEAFWAEGCCNGAQGGQFSVNGGSWQALSVSNLDRLAVPEPGSLALLGLGMAGLAWNRRRKA
jgi:hypothetical protein